MVKSHIQEIVFFWFILNFCAINQCNVYCLQMGGESLLEKQAEAKQGFLALSCILLFCYNASLGSHFFLQLSTFYIFCVNL